LDLVPDSRTAIEVFETAARLLWTFVCAQRIATRMMERGLWRGIRAQEGVPQLLCVHMKLHDADEFDRLPTD
jgi:hypothetical protein